MNKVPGLISKKLLSQCEETAFSCGSPIFLGPSLQDDIEWPMQCIEFCVARQNMMRLQICKALLLYQSGPIDSSTVTKISKFLWSSMLKLLFHDIISHPGLLGIAPTKTRHHQPMAVFYPKSHLPSFFSQYSAFPSPAVPEFSPGSCRP